MSIGFSGPGNTDFIKAAGTTATVQPGGFFPFAVGTMAIVVVAKDNASTTDGATSEVSGITDSVGGNTYTKLVEFTNSQSAANGGATISVWYSILATPLTNSSTITATMTSCTAKAMAFHAVTSGAGTTIGVVTPTVGQSDGTISSPTLSFSGLPSREYAYIGVAAVEGGQTDFPSFSGVSASLFNGTSGGAAASNMNVFIGWEATGSPNTGNAFFVDGNASGDWAAAYLAFYEIPGASTNSSAFFQFF